MNSVKPFPSPVRRLCILFSAVLTLVFFHQPARAQLSKATKIFINKGIELQGIVQYNDVFTLSTYSNANYTSVNWGGTSYQALLGPAPGFPWGRWVSSQANMPPQDAKNDEGFSAESLCMSQLVNLELADELYLDQPTTQSNEISWFNTVLPNYTNTVLFINNYAGQVSDQTLGNMMSQGHVDMICFDYYPFNCVYDTNSPNEIGPTIGGPYTSWMSELRRYRQDAMAYGIPFGTYMQTFHSVEDYDARVYRVPSRSELRFNNFAALAFNAKTLIGFVYNSGAAALFNILPNGYSGDAYTNDLYNEQVDVNRRAMNLGRSLACLKPVYDMHNASDTNPPVGPASAYPNFPDGITTSIMILKGNPGTATNTAEPIGFADSVAAPKSYSWWEFQRNDPYFNGWVVKNLGTNNGGLPGQVIISWFNVLDENLDGPTYSNEVYMMVVNALTATNGTSEDCLQQIKLNFQTGTNITSVDMLDLETGAVITSNMPTIGGSGNSTKRQLVLNLNGGDAAFFKFSDGAPFVGHVMPSNPTLSVQMDSGHPAITVHGTPLARYQVQSCTDLTQGNWTIVGTQLMTNSSSAFADMFATNSTPYFYRAVGLP